ncbi:MAG: DUF3606 domain-containing protein [Bacteroidota bacterium]|nr:DUF3606 domain-containing protein [Bacteroidota bacterium]
MSDNLHKKKLDAKRIDVSEPYELRDWSAKLGVTQQKLKNAVIQVGTSAAKVKEYLKK